MKVRCTLVITGSGRCGVFQVSLFRWHYTWHLPEPSISSCVGSLYSETCSFPLPSHTALLILYLHLRLHLFSLKYTQLVPVLSPFPMLWCHLILKTMLRNRYVHYASFTMRKWPQRGKARVSSLLSGRAPVQIQAYWLSSNILNHCAFLKEQNLTGHLQVPGSEFCLELAGDHKIPSLISKSSDFCWTLSFLFSDRNNSAKHLGAA